MKYDFDTVIDRRGTQCIKWDGGELIKKYGITQRFDADTIPLFVADMDFASPQPVLEALRKRVDQEMFGYSSHLTDPAYTDAILGWFSRRQHWEIHPGDLVYCPGTVHALDVAVRAFTKPEEGVIIQRPVYSPFTKVIEKNGRRVENNELRNQNGYYTMDFDDLEAKASRPDTTLMFLCSPHNPVGRIWQPEELEKVAQICSSHNVVLISDEIHGDLIRVEETFYPIANVAVDENIVICTAINKTFNLAGLHCSNIVIRNRRLRAQFQHELGMASPSPFAISALIAAYNEGEEWLEQLKMYIDRNFDVLEKRLEDNMPEVVFRRPEGTYIAWLDFSAYGLDPDEIHRRIYEEANVALEDGRRFGERSALFQRLCLPVPRIVLQEALGRIERQFSGAF